MVLKKILLSLIVNFVLILAFFIIPFSDSIRSALFPVVGILALLFLILGGVLIFVARKEKGKLRIFLIVTGASAIAPLPFSILHNVFYALGIFWPALVFIFEILSGASFLIALIVAPILFLVGIIGSLLLIRKLS